MNVDRSKRRVLIGLGFGMLAILLLAFSISQMEMSPGQRLILPTGGESAPVDREYNESEELDGLSRTILTVLFLIVAPISIIYVILNPKSWKRILRHVGIVLLFVLAIFAFKSLFDGGMGIEGGNEVAQQQPPETGGEFRILEDFSVDPPGWISFLVGFIVLALILGLAMFLWMRKRNGHSNGDDDEELERLVGGAEGALEELRRGANLRDTVIRCYHEMCETMGQQRGVRRVRAMTAREFEMHLASVGFRDEHIKRLTRLFEGVRYGGDQASHHETEREAKACLEAIVSTYARSAS